jgi:tRNA(Arg) A34 adenosine deaminase TadA
VRSGRGDLGTSVPLLVTSACQPNASASRATTPAQDNAPAGQLIEQPKEATDSAFAAYAEQMRQLAVGTGDQSFGAIVVKEGKVVGLGPGRVIEKQDATPHAEMEAIRDASRRLGTRDLSGCVPYSTSRPCTMCEMAAYWAQIGEMKHGRAAEALGAPRHCGR